jgi:hypothetical protein
MGIVQFREDDEVLDFLRSQGINPNALGRELLNARARRLRAEKRLAELQPLRRDLGDVVGAVREAREEH